MVSAAMTLTAARAAQTPETRSPAEVRRRSYSALQRGQIRS